jgi:hypothetical protein
MPRRFAFMHAGPLSAASFAAACALTAASAASVARGEPLTGDVGAAFSTPDAASRNPANAAFLDRTQVGFNPTLFTSESYRIRYPGFPSTEVGKSGASAPLAVPQLILKLNSRFGIGGIAAPPGIELPVQIKKIPLIVMKTQNFVDITGAATVTGFASMMAGFRFTNTFGVGVGGSYGGADIEAKMTPSEGGPALVTITGSASVANATAGARWDMIPGRISIGAAFGLINVTNLDLKIESPLMQEGEGASGVGESKPIAVANPLDSVLAGVQVALTPSFRILADVQFNRAPQDSEGFSIVELRQKKRDVHDVLAARAAAIIGITPSGSVLLGYKNQPASVGPGTPGEDGLNGFGTIDVIQTFIPMIGEELKPYWQVSGGAQFGYLPHIDRRSGKKGEGKPKGYYALTFATGLLYRRASLGIDENGELPGAYLRTTTAVPVQITYKF